MNNFFIARADLTDEQLAALTRTTIPRLELEVDDQPGLIFEQNRIVEFLTALRSDVISPSDTSIPGLVKLTVGPAERVTFSPEVLPEGEGEEPMFGEIPMAAPGERVSISAPQGFTNGNWEIRLRGLRNCLMATCLYKIVIHECYDYDEAPEVTPAPNELHLFIGVGLQYLDGNYDEGAVVQDRISCLPGGQKIGFSDISEEFSDSEYHRLVEDIQTFIPVAMASTREEGEEILSNRHQGVEIISPDGFYTSEWRIFMSDLAAWLKNNVTGVNQIKLYEAYLSNDAANVPSQPSAPDQLRIVVGRQIDHGGRVGDNFGYLANGRLINLFGFSAYPDHEDFEKATEMLRRCLPAALGLVPDDPNSLDLFKVQVDSFNGEMSQGRLRTLIRQHLLPAVKKNIVFHVPHGNIQPASTDGNFHILVWSAPSGQQGEEKTLARLWGYKVSCLNANLAVNNQDLYDFVISDETSDNYPVAGILGDNLYIFHDLVHYDRAEDCEIFRKILEKASEFLQLPEAERQQIINRPKVVIDNPGNLNLNSQRVLALKRATEEIILPAVNHKIIIHFPGNQSTEPLIDSNFHIFIWSAFSGQPGNAVKKMPDRLFGFNTDSSSCWNCFNFTETGSGLTDGQSDYVVAELVGDNNLYILIPLFDTKMREGNQIYRKILEKAVIELNLTPEERQRRNEEMQKKIRERNLGFYVAACSKRLKASADNCRGNIANQESSIIQYQQQLVGMIRTVKELKRQLAQLEQHDQADTKDFEEEYHKLTSLPGVKSVKITKNELTVHTANIYITTPVPNEGNQEVTFDIGEFDIKIYFDGCDGGLKFFNTTRRGTGGGYNVHHPHVNEIGSPCLGNISEMIAQLTAGYQFAAIALLALEYLESVNLNDSAGAGLLEHWPRVEKKPTTGGS